MISELSRVTLIVGDLERAAALLTGALDAREIYAAASGHSPCRGRSSSFWATCGFA